MLNQQSEHAPATNELLELNYSVNKLICVNSAKHGYSEIPLDQHMVLYGGNNQGKTVTLNMMKLLLFPDTNFKDCSNKFAFRSSNGSEFSAVKSYGFFFPSDHSYIILEGENPEGVYCMILYRSRGQDWGFGRLFVACDFASIRHLFWQVDAQDFAADLSYGAIKKGVKELPHVQVSDASDLAQMMYAGHSSADPKIRKFSVFPLLGEATAESIEAFRRIYQLAFDTSASHDKTLPMAIATLIEMQRSRPEERLDANLLQMAEEHEQLVEKGNWLQRLKNCTPAWETCMRAFVQAQSDYVNYSKQHNALDRLASKQRASMVADKQQAQEQFEQVRQQLNSLKQQGRELQQELLRREGGRKRLQSQCDKWQADISKAKQLMSGYASMTESEVVALYTELLADADKKVQEYQSAESMQQRFADLQRQIKDFKSERESLTLAIEQRTPSIAEQVTADEASKLAAINRDLAGASIALSASTQRTFAEFLALFTVTGNALSLQQYELRSLIVQPFDPAQTRAQQQQRRQQLDERIQDKEAEMREIAAAMKQKDISESLAKVKKERDETQRELTLVRGLATYTEQLREAQDELASDAQVTQQLQEQIAHISAEMEPLEQLYNRCHQHKLELDKLDQQLSQFRDRLKRMFDAVCPLALLEENIPDLELNEAALVAVERLQQRYHANMTEFKHHFDQLLRDLQPPEIENHVLRTRIEDFQGPIGLLQHQFETYEYDYEQHLKNIRAHNQYVNNQLRELHDAKDQIHSMVATLNQELNRKTISNLSEIRLELTLHPTFLKLLDTLDQHSIEDETLLDTSFYQEIRNFTAKHFHKRSRQLKLKDIIEKVSYSYLHANASARVKEGQSGGTTSTVTAFVLSVLLKQIVKRGCTMRLPIVVDEIGTLDRRNTEAVVSQIIEHGFTLFCATPNYSPVLNLTVGRSLELGTVKVRQVQVHQCEMHVLPEHINVFGPVADEA